MNDKFSLYQTDGLWGIIENTSNEKQTSIKSYFGSDLIIKRLNEQAEQIDQLKQQLEEKDKEIEEKMMSFEKRCQEYYKSDEFKRDFAIQELEKVKDYAWFNYEKFRNYLNQQIKELKGEKDEESIK